MSIRPSAECPWEYRLASPERRQKNLFVSLVWERLSLSWALGMTRRLGWKYLRCSPISLPSSRRSSGLPRSDTQTTFSWRRIPTSFTRWPTNSNDACQSVSCTALSPSFTFKTVMTEAKHNWSGGPGVYCEDCGIGHPREHPKYKGFISIPPCTEPGSRRFHPYLKFDRAAGKGEATAVGKGEEESPVPPPTQTPSSERKQPSPSDFLPQLS